MRIRWYLLAFVIGTLIGKALARPKEKKFDMDWERRYGELVEIVSRRTDQTKGKK
jgi:hypothetical protein